jgi:hypothetical protein
VGQSTGRDWAADRRRLFHFSNNRAAGAHGRFPVEVQLPVSRFDLNLFYPALMILLGAHYLPFVFLYGMRMFALLAALLLAGGLIIAMHLSSRFEIGAWYTAIVLLIFAVVGKLLVDNERKSNTV